MTLEECFTSLTGESRKTCVDYELQRLAPASEAKPVVIRSPVIDWRTYPKMFVLTDKNYSDAHIIKINLPVEWFEVSAPVPAPAFDFGQLMKAARPGHSNQVDYFFLASYVIFGALIVSYVLLTISSRILFGRTSRRTSGHAKRGKISGDFDTTKKPLRHRRRNR